MDIKLNDCIICLDKLSLPCTLHTSCKCPTIYCCFTCINTYLHANKKCIICRKNIFDIKVNNKLKYDEQRMLWDINDNNDNKFLSSECKSCKNSFDTQKKLYAHLSTCKKLSKVKCKYCKQLVVEELLFDPKTPPDKYNSEDSHYMICTKIPRCKVCQTKLILDTKCPCIKCIYCDKLYDKPTELSHYETHFHELFNEIHEYEKSLVECNNKKIKLIQSFTNTGLTEDDLKSMIENINVSEPENTNIELDDSSDSYSDCSSGDGSESSSDH